MNRKMVLLAALVAAAYANVHASRRQAQGNMTARVVYGEDGDDAIDSGTSVEEATAETEQPTTTGVATSDPKMEPAKSKLVAVKGVGKVKAAAPGGKPQMSPGGCAPGHFVDVGGSCKLCLVGRYQTNNYFEGTVCPRCNRGMFAEAQGLSVCKYCPGGYYMEETGQKACLKCAAGRYQYLATRFDNHAIVKDPEMFATGCSLCPPGFYSAASGSSQCTQCAPGKFQALEEQTACGTCREGKFAATPHSSECAECPSGYYQGSKGGSHCDQCVQGHFSIAYDGASSIKCTACAKGKYMADHTSSFCNLCPAGRFSSKVASVDCDKCEEGVTSKQGSPSCGPRS